MRACVRMNVLCTCAAVQLGVAESKEGAEGIIDMAAFLTANGMIYRTFLYDFPVAIFSLLFVTALP